jgi:hypothetical protein
VTDPVVLELVRRAGVLWVRLADRPPRLVWHLWHDGSAYVLCGGSEQALPGVPDAGSARVTVLGRDRQPREWTAEVGLVAAGSAEWDRLVPLLVARRLNLRDPAGAPARWAAECRLVRLTPR